MSKTEAREKRHFLDGIEAACNKLPNPAIIFMFLFVITAVVSLLLSALNVAVVNPASAETIRVKNFFSVDGLYWFLTNMILNFTSFPPLGLVLVMTVAVGFCEESGLIKTLLRDNMKHILPAMVPYVVAFIGILGNVASDTAIIVIPPMAGFLYYAVGKHPVAGMICGYAATEAGFSANLMVAGTDGLLQTISQDAADKFLGEGVISVDITCNWYFMVASTFLCTFVVGFMCNHFVDKRFGDYVPGPGVNLKREEEPSPREKKALAWAGISFLIFLAIVVCGTVWGPLGVIVGGETAGLRGFVGSYLLKNLVTVLVFAFCIPGIVYGLVSGSFKGLDGLNGAMVKVMGRMGGYLVFCFFCAQFQSLFSWTNIDKLLAINGAKLLDASGFTGFGIVVVFILFSGFINVFITSASAKWAIFAPVFIPMMLLAGGYHPAVTQVFYRIGDSTTNAFTPFMPYIWVNLKTAQDMYDPKLKLGTMVSSLLPIGLVLLAAWIVLLGVWMALGLPMGPGVETFVTM